MFKKIISLIISVVFTLQASGFAQAAQLNLAAYLDQGQGPVAVESFRPVHLRYFSYDSANNSYQILLDKGDYEGAPEHKNTSAPEKEDSFLKDSAKEFLNYFLIGLALPNDTFWVNLRPDAPENIIDPLLEKTEIGKIFLEADLQLKKDTASLTSPQNPEGKAYWDKLYKKAGELFGTENITIPTITRPWIVPNEVIVRETEDSAYIYKATLKVMLEEDYLRGMKDDPAGASGRGTINYSFNDPRLKELNEYSTQLLREKIIPRLTKEVNSSKRYAKLRQVYYSLVLSRWFKQRYGLQSAVRNKYISLIDSKNLTGLGSQGSWDKTAYFSQYKDSFAKGEYNLKENIATPYGQSIRSYVSGGLGMGFEYKAVKSPVAGIKVNSSPVTNILTEQPTIAGSPAVVDDPLKAIKKEAMRVMLISLKSDEYKDPNDLIDFKLTIFSKLPPEDKESMPDVDGAIEEYYIRKIANSEIEQESLLEVLRDIIRPFEEIAKDGEFFSSVASVKKAEEIYLAYDKLIVKLKAYSSASPITPEQLRNDLREILKGLEKTNRRISDLSGHSNGYNSEMQPISVPLSQIMVTVDKKIISLEREEISWKDVSLYVERLRDELNVIVPKANALKPNNSNNGPNIIEKMLDLSRGLANAAGKAGELYNKLNNPSESVGSPVGKELNVYNPDTAQNIKLRYVSAEKLAGLNKKTREMLQAAVFRSKIPAGNKAATYSFPVVSDAMLNEIMYFAVKAEGSILKSIEGIVYNEHGEIVIYGNTSYVSNAIRDVWNKEHPQEIVSSAVVSGQVAEKRGGIDLTDRVMSIKLERVGSFASTPLLLPQVKNAQSLDLDNEFKQIEALASSGISPNSRRILELFSVCYSRGEFGQRLSQIISCLKAASAIQEAEAIDSDDDFRLALMMPEALS